MRALEDGARARESGLREVRGHDAGVSGPAGMEPLGRGAVRQVLDDAARLTSAEPERGDQLRRRETEKSPGGGGGAEGPAERGRMKAPPMERARACAPDRRHDLDAGHEGG